MFAEGTAKEAYDVITQFSATNHLIIKTSTEQGAVQNVILIKSPIPNVSSHVVIKSPTAIPMASNQC